jgi:uncharacterized protein (TIGR03435 family)
MKIAAAALLVVTASAQQPASEPARFEVVSVKVDRAGTGGAGDSFPKNGRWHWTRIPLSFLIMYAYDTSLRQIAGIPKEFEGRDVAFDIDAKVPAEVTPAQFREMLQALLAERFQFRMHRGQREFEVTEIEVANGGHKLKPPSGDCVDKQQPRSADGEKPRCGDFSLKVSIKGGESHNQYTGRSVSMADIVVQVGKNSPVLDKTGISGLWDLEVGFDAEFSKDTDPEEERIERMTGFQRRFRDAFEKQAGLIVDFGKQKKRPLPVIVLDHVELPTAN